MRGIKVGRRPGVTVVSRMATYMAVLVCSVIFMVPFLWMISTSLKSTEQVFRNPPILFPIPVYFNNYAEAVKRIPYLRYTLNTLLIAVSSVIGIVTTASMVAYSLSKIRWKGGAILFGLVLATMMIPYQVTMIPTYMIWQRLKLTGSYWPLIIPCFTGGSYYVFLLRQFFMTIPDSLIDAATIDGANEARIFTRVMAPLAKPAMTSVGIFAFLYSWSDFLGPLLYINNQNNYTLSLGLQGYISEHFIEWNLLMAAAAIFTVPIIIIFFFAQKQFIEGITVTGLKG